MRRFFVYMHHSGEDVSLADFLFHEPSGFGEKGFNLLLASAFEELWTGGDERIDKHGAVFPGAASCRLDAVVNFAPVFVLRLDDMEVIFTAGYVYVGVAGVFLLCAFMVSLQRPGWPRLVFGKSQDCVFRH